MKKNVPAVFFQHQLTGRKPTVKRPEVLELFESQLRAVCGGFQTNDTFCGDSWGWADVDAPDDSGM